MRALYIMSHNKNILGQENRKCNCQKTKETAQKREETKIRILRLHCRLEFFMKPHTAESGKATRQNLILAEPTADSTESNQPHAAKSAFFSGKVLHSSLVDESSSTFGHHCSS